MKQQSSASCCWLPPCSGCVLYELASLRRAFDGGSLPALVVKILKGRYPPLPAGRYSVHLRQLVDGLLQQDPQVCTAITCQGAEQPAIGQCEGGCCGSSRSNLRRMLSPVLRKGALVLAVPVGSVLLTASAVPHSTNRAALFCRMTVLLDC